MRIETVGLQRVGTANIWTRTLRGRLMSESEMRKHTVESPQRVNNWRPDQPTILVLIT